MTLGFSPRGMFFKPTPLPTLHPVHYHGATTKRAPPVPSTWGPGKLSHLKEMSSSQSLTPHNRPAKSHACDHHTHPREQITVCRIERDAVAKTELRRKRVHLVPRNALPHAAVRIDCSSDPCIRVAQQPPAILHRPHAGHIEVLPGRARVAIPSIVRDVHQHFGAVARQLPHLVGKNRLVANENAISVPPAVLRIELENSVVAPSRER